jgi:hypothetical protein
MTIQSNNTIMRMRYLASEIGHTLSVVDPVAATFTLTKDIDRKTIHPIGAAASTAATKTVLAPVDPSIINSV